MSAPTKLHDSAEVWLATPDAADRFDPAALDSAGRHEWASIRTVRRRRDWESSRALLGAIPSVQERQRSLTHSHGFAGVALAPAAVAVGVDLEWMTQRDFRGMASAAFPPAECEYLDTLDERSDLCSKFYEFWTLKEAFAKALRLTLVDALRQCCMIDATGARRLEVPTTCHWRAIVFAPRPQLRLSVVQTCESSEALREAPHTVEWPSPRATEWPVVMDLEGGGRRGPGAW